MPEALAIVAVFLVSVVIYVVLWIQSRDPALYDPRKELVRLEHHVTWLEHRLAVARRENWGGTMEQAIVAELETARVERARLAATVPQTVEASR